MLNIDQGVAGTPKTGLSKQSFHRRDDLKPLTLQQAEEIRGMLPSFVTPQQGGVYVTEATVKLE